MMRPSREWEAPFSRNTWAEMPMLVAHRQAPMKRSSTKGDPIGSSSQAPTRPAAMGSATPTTATRREATPTLSIWGTVDSRPTANMSTTTPRPPSNSVAGEAATSGNRGQDRCRAVSARPTASSPVTEGSFRRTPSSPPTLADSHSRASSMSVPASGSCMRKAKGINASSGFLSLKHSCRSTGQRLDFKGDQERYRLTTRSTTRNQITARRMSPRSRLA